MNRCKSKPSIVLVNKKSWIFVFKFLHNTPILESLKDLNSEDSFLLFPGDISGYVRGGFEKAIVGDALSNLNFHR